MRYVHLHILIQLVLSSALSIATTSAVAQVVPAPVLSYEARTYRSAFDLTFDVPDGATVYYTTNGDIPTTSSTKYDSSSTVRISGTVMVRARAFRDGYEPSETVTNAYIRIHSSIADFISNLPIVVVNQFDNVMHPYGEHRSVVYVSILDRDAAGSTPLLTDELHVHGRSNSNYRGTSSLSFPKKQFGVRLIDEDGENRNERILGMPSENNWIMSAPYDDRTLIRNAVAYQVSRDMGRYAPRTRFVELFLHQGSGAIDWSHYHGVYVLTERIKWDDNRVDIAKLGPEDASEPEISGGYILNFEHGREFHINSTTRNTPFALVRPQNDDATDQQKSWISRFLGDLESALFGSSFRDAQRGYAAYLDPASFIDYHLITEAFKEMDGYRLSTYLHKDRRGRMTMGPVWDYNLSLGNYTTTEGWNGHDPTGWYHTWVPQEAYLNGWYTRLFEDPDFVERYRERWWELREGAFATENIVNIITRFVDELGEAVGRNFERWDVLGRDVWQWSREGFDTYDEEIDYMVDWIETRLKWIDSQMAPRPDAEAASLRYFWHFDTTVPNDTPLKSIDAGYSLIYPAGVRFESALDGYPFEEGHGLWRKASMERRNNATDLNYRPEGSFNRPYADSRTRGLQIKQPFSAGGRENTLIFHVPTTGLDHVVLRFAAVDEGAADAILVDYSTESGHERWTTSGLASHRLLVSDVYQLYSVDFENVDGASDNPHFKIRLRFEETNPGEDRGRRVTFNNISIDALSSYSTGVVPIRDRESDVDAFRLEQNYPNPFGSSTSISFSLTRSAETKLTVFDALGRRAAVLVDEHLPPGRHTMTFDASRLAGGLYVYRLEAAGSTVARAMVLLK